MLIDEWYADLISRRSFRLPAGVRVEGLRDAHLGPRWEFARIIVEAEPSIEFSVESPVELPVEQAQFLRAAIFGMLDVLLTGGPLPLREVKLRFVELEVNAVDSSSMAFREAGRDAARKLLALLR